jgi:hypothetical protein
MAKSCATENFSGRAEGGASISKVSKNIQSTFNASDFNSRQIIHSAAAHENDR